MLKRPITVCGNHICEGTVPGSIYDSTALPEVVGDAGIMVDPHDTAAIVAAIEQLLENETLQKQLRTCGLGVAREYTWERAAVATWQVLTDAASTN